jgi:hypothetical protein
MHSNMAGLPVYCLSKFIQSFKSYEFKKPDKFFKKECVLFSMLPHCCKQHCINVVFNNL